MLKLAVSLLGLTALAACEPYPGNPYGGYAAPAPSSYYGGGYTPYYAPPAEATIVVGEERDYYRGDRRDYRGYDRREFRRDERARQEPPRDDRRREAGRDQGGDRGRQAQPRPPARDNDATISGNTIYLHH